MKNLFENAKFGDFYISKDGAKNIFCSFTTNGSDTLARLYRENWGIIVVYLGGKLYGGREIGVGNFTIVGMYQEPICQDELEEQTGRRCKGKEATLRRPYRSSKEFSESFYKHGGSVHTKTGYNDIPVRVLDCGIVIIDFELKKKHDDEYVFIPYSKLLRNFRFLDETPCGIEE